MAKLTEAQKRKNFEATVGSSENDMGPLPVKKDEPKKKAEPKKKEDKVLPDQLMNNPVRFKKDSERTEEEKAMMSNYKKGGMVKTKKYSKGGTASSRADGIATKGKTRGKIC